MNTGYIGESLLIVPIVEYRGRFVLTVCCVHKESHHFLQRSGNLSRSIYCFSGTGRSHSRGLEFSNPNPTLLLPGFPSPHSNYIIDRSQSVILSSRYFPHKDLNVWDARSGHLRHSLQMPHATTRQRLAVSPDGQRAFCGSEGTRSYPCLITAWDLQTGQECYTLTPTRKKSIYIDWGANEGDTKEHGVCTMLTSRDGRLLINALYEGIIQIWDLQTGTFLRQFPVPHKYTDQYLSRGLKMALTPDGQTLFCQRFNYQDIDCFMLNVETGETLSQHSLKPAAAITFLAFSEDSQTLILDQPALPQYQRGASYPPSSEPPSAKSCATLSVWNWRSQQPPSPLMLEAIYP